MYTKMRVSVYRVAYVPAELSSAFLMRPVTFIYTDSSEFKTVYIRSSERRLTTPTPDIPWLPAVAAEIIILVPLKLESINQKLPTLLTLQSFRPQRKNAASPASTYPRELFILHITAYCNTGDASHCA